MSLKDTYRGLLIGSCFTLVSYLLSYTIIFPMVSVYPESFLLEDLSRALVGNDPYGSIVRMTMKLLWVILLGYLSIVMLYIFIKVRQGEKITTEYIILVLIPTYFIIHPLGFYICVTNNMTYPMDGQLILGVILTVKYSSFGFMVIGGMIDIVKNIAVGSKEREV